MAQRSIFRRLSKRFFITANLVVVLVFLLACLQPWLNPEQFWFIGFLSLALPYLLLVVVAFLLFWAVAKPRYMLISAIALVLGYRQISVLYNLNHQPFTAAKKESRLRVLSWNIRSFQGAGTGKVDKRANADRIMQLIDTTAPDVVCFQEFGQYNKPGLGENYVKDMEALGYRYHVQSKDYTRVKYYYTNGLAIFSRYPIIAQKRIPFTSNPESLLYADVAMPLGDTIRIFTTHLQSFKFTPHEMEALENASAQEKEVLSKSRNIVAKMKRAFRNRGSQADQIASYLDSSAYPAVFTADLNDVPGSYAYWRLCGQKLQDAFLAQGYGLGRTFLSLAPTLRIDYIMASLNLPIEQFAVLNSRSSDHLPLVADILLPSGQNGLQKKPAGKSRKL